MDSQARRKILFVDAKVQGALVLRALSYWFFCLLTVVFMVLLWRILQGPPQMFYMHVDAMCAQFGPALIASVLLLPVVLIDSIRLSNRFAGPLVRLRRAMRAVSKGEQVEPVIFRDGDYWQEFADDFNAMAEYVHKRAKPAKEPAKEPATQLKAEAPSAKPAAARG
jgi:hypothetical protein